MCLGRTLLILIHSSLYVLPLFFLRDLGWLTQIHNTVCVCESHISKAEDDEGLRKD